MPVLDRVLSCLPVLDGVSAFPRKDKGIQGETSGDKTLGKADAQSKQGNKKGRQGETTGDKGRQKETRGDKTLGKADTPSNKMETRRETIADKGRQDPREGGHAVQHQGGHLKKALRTPNLTAHCLGKIVRSVVQCNVGQRSLIIQCNLA